MNKLAQARRQLTKRRVVIRIKSFETSECIVELVKETKKSNWETNYGLSIGLTLADRII